MFEQLVLPTSPVFEKLYALEGNKSWICQYLMSLHVNKFNRNQNIAFFSLLLSGMKYKRYVERA